MRHLKRGGGGADPGEEAVLDFVGLGEFARLSLPELRPGELGLSAAYDDSSGRIAVSVCGGAVSVSPADLAAALGLPLGSVGLLPGCDAAAFSTAEVIGAVRRFICDRLLLGWGESSVAVSMEVARALQLVEEGKAYEVDWGGLIWAVVKREVIAGTPRRYAPYLLHLMVRQRPELSVEEGNGSLPLGKRLKGQVLQQCQFEDEEEASLVFWGTQNIGDIEEMPIFGSQNTSFFPQQHELGANCSHQSLSCFQAVMQQIQGYVRDMESSYLDKERTCRDTRHEVECIKNMVMEKDQQIEATLSAIRKELSARSVIMRKFEADKDHLSHSVQLYHKLLKKCSTKFHEYRMVTRGEGDSYLEDLGITGGGVQMQQMPYQCQMICGIQETCASNSSKLVKKMAEMERNIASLSHEVERLKNCRSIPDLNNGVEDHGEDKASLAMTLGASWTGEGDRVSNTAQDPSTFAPQNNPPCTTLFVANLGPACSEQELIDVFSSCVGFVKLKMQNKVGAPVAFVDFKDAISSAEAINRLQGVILYSSPGEGMHLEYAKSQMGLRMCDEHPEVQLKDETAVVSHSAQAAAEHAQ